MEIIEYHYYFENVQDFKFKKEKNVMRKKSLIIRRKSQNEH